MECSLDNYQDNLSHYIQSQFQHGDKHSRNNNDSDNNNNNNKSNYHILRIHYVSATVPNILYGLSHLIFTATL